MTIDIPVNAQVQCADGSCGRSTSMIVDPTTKQVTHLVVDEGGVESTPRLVPIEFVTASTPHTISLSCTKGELEKMAPFVKVDYIEGTEPFAEEYELVPPGELAEHRGARVEATDGHVGQLDGFLIDSEDDHITHLVLREGHLWGQKDVTIPVSQIDHIEENTVYLKLDKHGIEALPTIPVRG
jgi:sporulation protein YlmC with PRC-barrel domain